MAVQRAAGGRQAFRRLGRPALVAVIRRASRCTRACWLKTGTEVSAAWIISVAKGLQLLILLVYKGRGLQAGMAAPMRKCSTWPHGDCVQQVFR